jgi:hypothetical protein
MLSGFNTNVRHRSIVFHVQSEDSGRSHPHVITHLYHGGTILASEKTSYADQLDAADLPAVVKALMERQHKSVLRRLVSGAFDELIRERLGDPGFAGGGEPRGAPRPTPEPEAAAPTARAAGASAGDGADAATLREPRAGDRSFGAGIVSERPLDEVILDYLVESARQRKRRAQ